MRKNYSPSDEITRIDNWVEKRPIRTFLIVAIVSSSLFVLLYWLIGTYRIDGGFRLDDVVTNYVGYLVTAAVALTGALVSVMLARLALKLGREGKATADLANKIQEQILKLTENQGHAADAAAVMSNKIQGDMHDLTKRLGDASMAEAVRANQIQEQMRKFGDPRLTETREGQKAAASLDLLGTLLRVYSAEAFSSTEWAPAPIEAIRHTYKRCNDLVSNPDLYRYCAQLIGTAATADTFASLQAMIYESTLSLGQNGDAGRKEKNKTARNAEKVAVKIAALSRLVEREKIAVLRSDQHALYQLAVDLDWQDSAKTVSGCEATARGHFLREADGAGILTAATGETRIAVGSAVTKGGRSDLDALFHKGKKSSIHVLATDLQDLICHIENVRNVGKIIVHESLGRYAYACLESEHANCANVIIARWESTLEDHPRAVSAHIRDYLGKADRRDYLALGSQRVWDRAVFLAENPTVDRLISSVLQDEKFLREIRQEDVSDILHEFQGIDPDASENSEVVAEARRIARLSAKRIWYIHAAIRELKAIHSRNGVVAVPDMDPYEEMRTNGDAIVVVRPYFSKIEMSSLLPGQESQNQWFEDLIAGYEKYRWDGEAS